MWGAVTPPRATASQGTDPLGTVVLLAPNTRVAPVTGGAHTPQGASPADFCPSCCTQGPLGRGGEERAGDRGASLFLTGPDTTTGVTRLCGGVPLHKMRDGPAFLAGLGHQAELGHLNTPGLQSSHWGLPPQTLTTGRGLQGRRDGGRRQVWQGGRSGVLVLQACGVQRCLLGGKAGVPRHVPRGALCRNRPEEWLHGGAPQ